MTSRSILALVWRSFDCASTRLDAQCRQTTETIIRGPTTMHRTALMLAALLAIHASQTFADVDGIQNHPIQKMFMESPCITVIIAIDGKDKGIKDMGMMAMAFGFMMGFEASHPNIRGEHETILKRLRADCTIDSNQTAFELLQGYAAE